LFLKFLKEERERRTLRVVDKAYFPGSCIFVAINLNASLLR
jgi:hypothetical protein